MNCISFHLIDGHENPGDRAVAISIDGQDLLQLVRVHELPFARREGHESIAGGYVYLSASHVRPPSRHFWGDPSESESYDGKIALAECECGCPGCWPLLCKISFEDGDVIWSNFEQPHRQMESAAGLWDYSAFGPFRFDREEYERALGVVAAEQGVGPDDRSPSAPARRSTP